MATSTAPSIDPEAVKAAQAALDSMPASAEAPGVDKIRELLFGNQMQDYDRRFSKLEERFSQRFKDVESEAKRSLEAYESNSKKQVESLAAQLRNEGQQRLCTLAI